MKWLFLLLLAAASAGAQTYVKPYSLSFAVSEKVDRKVLGPMVTKSHYEMGNAVSASLSYRTAQDKIRMGLVYSHSIQSGTNTVSAEIRYNVLQWGRRPNMSSTR